MSTNMTGFRWFQNLCILVFSLKVASALEGLRVKTIVMLRILFVVWDFSIYLIKSKDNSNVENIICSMVFLYLFN